MTIKVLGPAGGREAFDAALAAGADEIYMGLAGYGARHYAANFSTEEFCQALNDAHRVGAGISLTLNTIMSESEIETVTPDLDRLVESKLDSVIVQDFGVIRYLQRRYPKLAIHASTQSAVGNSREVRFMQKCGVTRVVLPRELSFDEIAQIRRNNPDIELEVFCSGALCLGCSGKCYLSSFVGGRSGNRGACAQPCRHRYQKCDVQGKESYLLSLSDQLMGEREIRRLAEIGVDVIKIEGRMKSPPYVFETVRYYRTLADKIASDSPLTREEETYRNRVTRIFNRGYGSGFVYEHNPDILNRDYASHYGFKVGEIHDGKIRLTGPLVNGDGIVYLDSHLQKLDGTNVSRINLLPQLYGDRVQKVPAAAAGDAVLLDSPPPAGSVYLYKTLDFTLHKETAHLLKQSRRRRPIHLHLTAKIGKPLSLTLSTIEIGSNKSFSVSHESEQLLEVSKKQRLDRENLLQSVDRFGNTPFFISKADFDFDPETFLPKSLLNSIRQSAAEELEKVIVEKGENSICLDDSHLPVVYDSLFERKDPGREQALPATRYAAAVRTVAQGIAAFNAGITRIYRYPAPVRFEDDAQEIVLNSELISSDEEENNLFSFEPIAGNLSEALFYEERGVSFATDSSFNIGNLEAAYFLLDHFQYLSTIYLSNELSKETTAYLGQELAPFMAGRGGYVGSAVYGHPTGMYTRKTLFEKPKTEIINYEGRKFYVLRNSDLYAEQTTRNQNTGSSVFYSIPNDQYEETRSWRKGWELRFDFVTESPSEIMRILSQLKSGTGKKNGLGYGFDHPIF